MDKYVYPTPIKNYQGWLEEILANAVILAVSFDSTVDNSSGIVFLGCRCNMKTEKEKFEAALDNVVKTIDLSEYESYLDMAEIIAMQLEGELDRQVFVIKSEYIARFTKVSLERQESNLTATLLS